MIPDQAFAGVKVLAVARIVAEYGWSGAGALPRRAIGTLKASHRRMKRVALSAASSFSQVAAWIGNVPTTEVGPLEHYE